MTNKASVKSPDAAKLRSLIDLCQVQNEHEDQEFLKLIRKAADAVSRRADALEINLTPILRIEEGDGRMVLVKLSLALTHLRVCITTSYPDLLDEQTRIVSMEGTFIGRARGSDFRSTAEIGIIDWSKITMTVPELQKHIGAAIVARRKVRSLTQQDLAAAIDMSQASIGRIEAGTQRLGMSVLYFIALALQVSPAELFPAEMFPILKPKVSLEQVRRFRKDLPGFDREVLQRWEEELVAMENRRAKKE